MQTKSFAFISGSYVESGPSCRCAVVSVAAGGNLTIDNLAPLKLLGDLRRHAVEDDEGNNTEPDGNCHRQRE